MSAKFVVSHLDQQIGPFTEAELKNKWSKGELLPIDYVYDEAKADWILLAERFAWTTARSETTPPPLKPATDKKKAPPVPVQNVTPVHAAQVIALPAPVPAPMPAPAATVTGPVQIANANATWTKPNGQSGAKVKIVDGVGVLDIPVTAPGLVEFALQDSSNANLKLQEPLKVSVKPVEPEEIQWAVAPVHTVGQELEITLKAVDARGQVCSHYTDEFQIRIESSDPRTVVLPMTGGQAKFKITNTKAENWNLSLHYQGARNLRLPVVTPVDWLPGPAARLILDGPPELVAGNPLKVQVKAVDQYGNLAKTFQGTVILEVKAS